MDHPRDATDHGPDRGADHEIAIAIGVPRPQIDAVITRSIHSDQRIAMTGSRIASIRGYDEE